MAQMMLKIVQCNNAIKNYLSAHEFSIKFALPFQTDVFNYLKGIENLCLTKILFKRVSFIIYRKFILLLLFLICKYIFYTFIGFLRNKNKNIELSYFIVVILMI